MKISRSTDCRNTTEALYRLWAEAGFEALDMNETADSSIYSHSPLEYISERIGWAEKYGMTVDQCHGVSAETYAGKTEDEIRARIAEVAESVKLASDLGINFTVVHPFIYSWSVDDLSFEKTFELNVGYLTEISSFAENTVLCLENMPGPRGHLISGETMKKYADKVEGLCFCLDTGHAFSNKTSAEDFFQAVGDKIKVLHIHDTVYGYDRHQLAYTGIGDWAAFKETLRKHGYSGNLNSESAFSVRTLISDRLLLEKVEAQVMRSLLP